MLCKWKVSQLSVKKELTNKMTIGMLMTIIVIVRTFREVICCLLNLWF